MSPPIKIFRLARVALIGAAVLMGVALLATVWSTFRGVNDASQTLIRGQADVFFDRLRVRLGELEHPANAADLEPIVAEYAEEGLRYIGLFDGDAVLASAGEPSIAAPALAAEARTARPGEPEEAGGVIRVVYRRPERRNSGRASRWTHSAMVIEFAPEEADDLRATATRTVGIGGLAGVGFLIVALGLVRWFWRREALERRLEHDRRLASLGEMSAVLAHEIRNPLASLKGNAQLLARALPDGDKPRAKAERVVEEAVRLEALTNDLLEFARTGSIERADLDPVALLREAAAAVADGEIELITTGAPARWRLDADRMRQVLTNLLENAVQAGGERVRATVTQQGGRLIFSVRDFGGGIADEDLPRLFEPFFTRRTRGTGLGLAVAKRLVELHGGTIGAANAAGGGAEFRIEMPRA